MRNDGGASGTTSRDLKGVWPPMISLAVMGAAGRMGRRIIACIGEDKDVRLAGAVEAAHSKFVGSDAGLLGGLSEIGVLVVSDPERAVQVADVVIDFSNPDSTI